MLLRPRFTPPYLSQLQAAVRRLPSEHPARPAVEQELYRTSSGDYGERRMDYYYQFLPDEVTLLHQVQLPSPITSSSFQMDTLLLHPQFTAILEIKHQRGSLHLMPETGQMKQLSSGEVYGYTCPVQQVRQQEVQLRAYAETCGYTNPILTHVFFTHSSVYFDTAADATPLPVSRPIMLSSIVKQWLQETASIPPQTEALQRLQKKMLTESTSHWCILDKFQLTPSDFLVGVWCTSCSRLSMRRRYSTWQCSSCGIKQAQAHVEALRDFHFLHPFPFRSDQLQRWMRLTNQRAARRLAAPFLVKKAGTYVYRFNF
ncbi:nuclease-related domain-containing protein [Alkalicoccus chagannorensis]|uniref:nuclease-related domain-containing protein n=1 Tax=Alkalicoccus chagannorensis TaxID=427072 RepID=UPI00041C3622|nr:nuclease-related domain-containing protein [Alkalicoccus chagannorensis]